MKAEGLNDAAIAAFKYNLGVLLSGASTMIPEADIGPVESLPNLESLDVTADPSLLKSTVMLKLNGGLGTGMGLDRAKSLLEVTKGQTFLDLIAQQVASMKAEYKAELGLGLSAWLHRLCKSCQAHRSHQPPLPNHLVKPQPTT